MKLRKTIAAILAGILLVTGCAAAFAEQEKGFEPVEKQIQRLKKLAQLEELKQRKISLTFNFLYMCYELKEMKFYGRRITGVTDDLEWELGSWELLIHDTDVKMQHNDKTENWTVPGHYVAFAWSADVMWGTDWPYSGVFWNAPNTPIDSIIIKMYGLCRDVRCEITVDGTVVVDQKSCDSHKEWKP